MGKVYWRVSEAHRRWAYRMWQGILSFKGGRGFRRQTSKNWGFIRLLLLLVWLDAFGARLWSTIVCEHLLSQE